MKRIISAIILLLAVCLCLASCAAVEDFVGQIGGFFGIGGEADGDGDGENGGENGGDFHVHEYGEWEISAEPDCEHEGIKIGKCECGATTIDSIPATGHKPTEVKGYEATCIGGGLTDGVVCGECGKAMLDQMITDALGHDMRDENIKDENCYVSWHLYCTRCDYEEWQSYGNVDHNFGEWEHVNGEETDNDCTLDLVYVRNCLDCGKMDIKYEKGTGHEFDVWIRSENETDQCSCVAEIVYTRVCYKCGFTDYRFEQAPGHNYTDPADAYVSVDPTEESYGEILISSCRNCECCKTTQILPPLYIYSIYEYEYKPETIGEAGYRKYTYLYEYGSFSWTVVIPAVEMKDSQGLSFQLSEDGSYYILSGLGECKDEHIFIPATYSGLPVKEIGYDALSRTPVKTIYIPRSIEKISNRAFFSLEHLETIIVEEGNQYYHSAGNCLIETATKTLMRGTNRSVIPNDGSVTAIGEGAFSTSQITHLDIPEGVTILGASAFWCCGIQSISLPSTLKTIGYGCFNATRLTEVIIPEGVETIASDAFTWCSELKSIKIPSTVKEIYYNSINNCPIEYLEYNGCYYLGTEENPYLYLIKASDNIQTLDIHPDTKIIAGYAFQSLTYLVSATVPSTIESLGSSSFYGCSSLCEVYIDATYVGSYSFMNCTSLVNVVIGDNTLDLGELTFSGCTSLVNLTLGQSLERIGSVMFSFCDSLTYVVIPDSVVEILDSAFSCANLETIVIGSGVRYIDNSAIPYSVPLKTVYYKGTLEEWRNLVPDYAYPYSEADIYFYSDIQPTDEGKFWHYVDGVITPWPEVILPSLEFRDNGDGTCTVVGLGTITDTDIVIPERDKTGKIVVSISKRAFQNNTSITSVTLPSTLRYMDEEFYGCTSISRVYISDLEAWCRISFACSANPMAYGADLYLNGELVTELVIPDSISMISKYSFLGCTSIEKLVIGSNCILVDCEAFAYCTSLKEIVIEGFSIALSDYAFLGCDNIERVYFNGTKLNWEYLPKGNNENYLSYDKVYFFSGTRPTEDGNFWHYVDGVPTVWPEVTEPVYSEGLIYSKIDYRTCYVSGIGDCSDTDIVIPDVSPDGLIVVGIGETAFLNCTSIVSIAIPDSVSSIGSFAFYGCENLEYIKLPNELKTIDENAFYGCKKISYIELPYNVEIIGKYAFYGCTSLESIYVPSGVNSIGESAFANCKSLKAIVIPDGVVAIEARTFHNCNALLTVTIPYTVKKIGERAFFGCSKISNVHFTGSERQWKKIAIDDGNEDVINANVYFYVTEEE